MIPGLALYCSIMHAITKLCTSRPWLSKLPSYLIPKSITVHMLDLVKRIVAKESKPLLISLLHCLYEAQDLSLCQFVAQQLAEKLDLSSTTLTQVNCLAIGYFLSSVIFTTSNIKVFRINLAGCSLGDAGTKSLMHSISGYIDTHSTINTHLYVRMECNKIHEEGASHIADILSNTSVVSGLLLNGNPIGDKGLQTIFNSLKQNNALRVLSVSECGMTSTAVPSLAEAMNLSTTLERLAIIGNPIGDHGLQTMFISLKQNTKLKFLNISDCGMTNAGVPSLAEAMNVNTTLKILYINGNDAITDDGLACLAEVLFKSSTLVKLWIPSHLKVDEVKRSINEARARSGLEAIELYGKYIAIQYLKVTIICRYIFSVIG